MSRNMFLLILFVVFFSVNTHAGDYRAYYHYMMGDKYFFEDNLESAVTEYVKASIYDSNSSQIRLKIASCFIQAEDFESAAVNIKKAIELDPENTEAKLVYAQVLVEQTKYSKALELCKEILNNEPYNARAVHCYSTMLIVLDKDSEAKIVLKNYLKQNPEDEKAYYGLGLLYANESDLKNSEKAYKNSLEINPSYIPSMIDLISLYEEKYSGQELIDKLQDLSQMSSLKMIKDKLVRIYVELGAKNKDQKISETYYSKALEYVEIIEAENPELSNIKMQKALIQDEMGKSSDAIKTLEKAVAEFPNNDRIMFYLASIYDKNNKKDEALKLMEKIIDINPENAEALNYVGYIYVTKKIKMAKAKELIKRALEILPEDPYITDSLGWVYYNTGDYTNAIIQFEKALILAKKDKAFEPEIIEHLISAYQKAGLSQKIEQIYSDLMSLGIYKEKRSEIKSLFEKINEGPERSPASIDIKK